MLAPFLEHVRKARPLLRTFVLATEFAFAIAPAAVGDDRSHALVDAGGIDRDRTAEARADNGDARGINIGLARQEGQRIAGILDLLEADHAARLAFALSAPAHVEAQSDVA